MRLMTLTMGVCAIVPFPLPAAEIGTEALAIDEVPQTIPVDAATAEEPATTDDSTPAPQIEEILVTATKRDAAVRDIPASIVPIPMDELERRGAQGVEDIVKLVPGVNLTADIGTPRITIRGISAETGTNLTTGVLFGNVSFVDAYIPIVALDPNPFDLKSVEILKGPQGTLFGASALNGAVRYVPEPPHFGEFQLRYFGQYNSLTHGDTGFTYGAAVNLPLGVEEKLALRITAFDRDSPGAVDNLRVGKKDADQTDQQGVRGILGWRPTDDWDIAATYAWQSSHVADYGLADNTEGHLSSDNRPRLSPKDTTYRLAELTLDRQFEWGSFVSESAYVKKEGTNNNDQSRALSDGSTPLATINFTSDSKTWSQEFRVTSPQDPGADWQWLSGVSASQQDIVASQRVGTYPLIPGQAIPDPLLLLFPPLADVVATGGSLSLLAAAPDVKVKEIAWFGDVTRRLGSEKQFEVSVGGRLYRTTSGGTNRRSGALIPLLGAGFSNTLDEEVSETGFNPKASLLWHVNDDIIAYTAASKGFRVGGVQPGITLPTSATPAPNTFKSDTLWNYEAGLRTRWFDNTLQFDVTGFLIRWDKPQTIQKDSSGLTSYIDNVGGVKSTGADVTLHYLTPVPGLSLTIAGSYARTVTSEAFRTGTGRETSPGDPWPYAPRWQTASTIAQAIPMGQWILGAGVTHTYLGTAVNNLAEQRPIFNYRQVDLNLELRNETLPMFQSVSIAVNNLLDEQGVVNFVEQGFAAMDVTYIQPRSFVLRLNGSF